MKIEFSKEIELLKVLQTEMMLRKKQNKTKTSMSQMKTSVNSLSDRAEHVENGASRLEDKVEELIIQ